MDKPHFRHRGEPVEFRIGEFEYTKSGVSRFDWRDPYHFAVSISWPLFFATLSLIALGTHLFFATLYWLKPGSVANAASFLDDFFFSVETLATVGYGVFSPVTLYGHIVSGIEIYTGLMQTALVTGLIFVRFSRPKGKIVFATTAVVSTIDGVPTLMLRLANAGLSILTAAEAGLHVIMLTQISRATVAREWQDLTLVRKQMPLFPLIWVLRHPIDEKSPLYGLTPDQLAEANARFFATCSAYDPSLGARVSGTKNFGASEVMFGMRYQDAISVDGRGRPGADYSRIHLIEEDTEQSPSPPPQSR